MHSLVLLGSFSAMVALAYYVFVTYFFFLGASVQAPVASCVVGRLLHHLAATVVVERLSRTEAWAVRRLILAVGVFVPALQLFSVYWNARRYAVGADGPVWFASHSL